MNASRVLGLVSILTSLAWSPFTTAAPPPNVIVVLADDLGYGDVSTYNPNSKIATPNIDRLAREGMKFRDAHTASGVCTPTRYALMTGRYPWRTHLQAGVLGGFSRPLIAKDRLTLAGLFKRHGYGTACFGKWHLGMDWPLAGGGVADDKGNFGVPFKDAMRVDYKAPIQEGPLDRGFDRYFGIAGSLDMFPFVWIEDRQATEVPSVEKTFVRAGPAGPKFEAVDVQPGIFDHAIAYVADRAADAKAGRPFFAYVPLASPHTPIVPTERWRGKSGLNAYADFVLQLDHDMGRLLAAIDEHGLTENTLVIFTSDNGCSPEANIGALRAQGHNPSHVYRGHKADLYEGGHRVPFLVRWPGQVEAGAVSDQMIGQFDLMATFAELLGEELPANAGEDSVSFLPTALGKEGPARTSLISHSVNGSFAIRDGDWKLALCPGSGGWSFPRPGQDDTSDLPSFQLFNLKTDPGEQANLSENHPDRVAKMKTAMETAVARGRTTAGPDQKNDTDVVMIKPAPKPAKKK